MSCWDVGMYFSINSVHASNTMLIIIDVVVYLPAIFFMNSFWPTFDTQMPNIADNVNVINMPFNPNKNPERIVVGINEVIKFAGLETMMSFSLLYQLILVEIPVLLFVVLFSI